MGALLLTAWLVGNGSVALQTPPPGTSSTMAQPDVTAPTPRTDSAPPPPPAPQFLEERFGPNAKVPWKLISKITAGVAYGAWVGLWTLSVPAFVLGATMLALSAVPAFGAAFLAIGGLVVALSVVLCLAGTAALVVGVGFGIPTLLLQYFYPEDKKADDNPASMILPRSVFL